MYPEKASRSTHCPGDIVLAITDFRKGVRNRDSLPVNEALDYGGYEVGGEKRHDRG